MNASDRPSILAPFTVRSFRFQWPADLFTSWAFEMETLVLGWYVLTETGSVLALTLFGALQFAGTLISPLFGVAGDRIGSRNLLCMMRALYAGLAAVLAAFATMGLLSPAMVLTIAALNGAVRPSDQGTRVALVGEIIPADQLSTAISIARTTSDSARVIGALAGAGLFAMLGLGAATVAVAGFYALGFLFTLGVTRYRAASGASHKSAVHDLTDGLAYIRTTPHLLAVMCLAFLVNLTAFPVSHGLLPYFVREVFHSDETGLGYLVATFAAGGLLGSVVLSTAGRRINAAGATLAFTAAWYVCLLVFAQLGSERGAGVVLLLAGFAQSFSMVPSSILLMQACSQAYRGRVMGVRMLAVNGLPLGLLAAGALTPYLTISRTVALFAAVGLVLTGAITVRWHRDLFAAARVGQGHGPTSERE